MLPQFEKLRFSNFFKGQNPGAVILLIAESNCKNLCHHIWQEIQQIILKIFIKQFQRVFESTITLKSIIVQYVYGGEIFRILFKNKHVINKCLVNT